MNVRKNQNQLSDAEKQRFTAAVLQMKQMPGGTYQGVTVTLYDKFVAWHNHSSNYDRMGGMAMSGMNHPHRNPAFGPWHRFFLAQFEKDLQAADRALGKDGTITVPYWDWAHDNNSDPKGQRGSVWKDNFMGSTVDASGNRDSGDSMKVITGPFREGSWTINVLPPAGFNQSTYLRRGYGADPGSGGSLPDKSDVDTTLGTDMYDYPPWNDNDQLRSFRNVWEGWFPLHAGIANMHNRVHVWVDGSMQPLTSPNDPIFFLHHANIDRIWTLWQARHPGQNYPASRDMARLPRSTWQINNQDDGAQMAGTVHTNGAASTTLTGIGTSFNDPAQAGVGDTLWIADMTTNPITFIAQVLVQSIGGATSMTVDKTLTIASPGYAIFQGPAMGLGLNDPMYPWDGSATSLTVRPIDVLNNLNMSIGGVDYSNSYAADPTVTILP